MNNDQRPVNNSFYDAVIRHIYEEEKENANNGRTTEDFGAEIEPSEVIQESVCSVCDCSRQ